MIECIWKASGTTKDKWEDKENNQGRNCHTNIPLVQNDIKSINKWSSLTMRWWFYQVNILEALDNRNKKMEDWKKCEWEWNV